jgi:predicted phage terminase large subunit-like protein
MPTPEEIQEAVRSLAHDRLLAFILVMYPEFQVNWHHKLLAEKLEAVERGEIKRLMVFMPPRHGKSLECSQMFPAWFIGRNPKKQIITATYGHSLAASFGMKVRNVVQEPRFERIFNKIELAEDSKAKDHFNITVDSESGGAYIATGIGGAITGYGAHLLLIDDPVKDQQDADSEVIRARDWDWYLSTASTRLMPDGAIIVIQTRWHDADLAGMILSAEKEKWDVVSFPAIAEQDEQFRKKGEALWPEQFSLEHLEELKQTYIKAGKVNQFYCLYQQNPINELNAEFKREWFKYYRDDECPTNMRIYTTVDPAISKKASADDSCVMTVGVTPDNSKFILEYTNAKLNPSELIEEIFRHFEKYRSSIVGIETVAYQEALSHFLKIEMRKRNMFMRIEEIKSREDKESKIRGLIAHYQNGSVFHRAGFCDTLEQQLLRFPKSAHDDVMDALAMQQQLWEAPLYTKWTPPKGKSLKQLMKEEQLFLQLQ